MSAVGNRSSSFSFKTTLASSTLAVEGDDKKRSVFQMHTGVGLRNPIASISSRSVYRVSFAPTPMFLLQPILALQANLVEPGRFMLATFLLTFSYWILAEGRVNYSPIKGWTN